MSRAPVAEFYGRRCNLRKAKALLYRGVPITKRGGAFYYEPREAERILQGETVQRSDDV